jgi:anti-sigma regulatory factor (Ser/Thr protein kinase)
MMRGTTTADHGQEVIRSFLASPAVAGLARDLVERQARTWGLDGLRNDLLAVVAELVGNAVEISGVGDVIKVRMRRDITGVVLLVWDSSNERPMLRNVELTLDLIDALPEDHEFGGWGLSIVERLCDRTGIHWTPPSGKWVWGRLASAVGHETRSRAGGAR